MAQKKSSKIPPKDIFTNYHQQFLIPQGELDLFHYMIDQIGDDIMVLDKQSRIVFANAAMVKSLGYAKKNILNRPVTDFMEKKISLRQWQKTYFMAIKKRRAPVSFNVNRVVKGGKVRRIDVTGVYMPYKSREYILVVGRDITQQLAFQEKFQEMETLMRESEKMKALQHFIVGATCEIQQPLKGLLNRSQGLINKYKDRHFEYIGYKEFSDIIKTLETMNDQMKYCCDTTDRLLGMSRRKAKVKDSQCAVNAVVREAVGLLKHSLEVSNISVNLNLSSRLPHVAIGALDLNQALNNILTNAIQSLPAGGGKIRIKTTYQKAEGMVRIDCQDNGVGIPKEALARVFEPFFTTKPRGLEKNSGLGLSIVYSIIKNYQGEISIKSHLRQGTCVTIFLPVHKLKSKTRGNKGGRNP